MDEKLDLHITPLINIKAGMKRINIKGIVLEYKYIQSKQDMMRNFMELKFSDESACGIGKLIKLSKRIITLIHFIAVTVFDSQIMKYIDCGDILLLVGVWAKIFRNQLRIYTSSNIQKIGDFCMVFNDKINISEEIKEVSLEQHSQLLNISPGSLKQLEVKQLSKTNGRTANKLEVIGHAMKIKGENNSPHSFDPKRKYSPYQQQQKPQNILLKKISKPYSLSTKKEISISMKQLLELQRKPSAVLVNKPIHPQNKDRESPVNKKRTHSPIKAPISDSAKVRIAHASSTSTNLHRSNDALESKKNSLKYAFHHEDP